VEQVETAALAEFVVQVESLLSAEERAAYWDWSAGPAGH
jgi:hypothetical protein